MNALKALFTRIDAGLDFFWIGVVLRQYHMALARLYSRKAQRLVNACDLSRKGVGYVLEGTVHQARRHELEAQLIAFKFV